MYDINAAARLTDAPFAPVSVYAQHGDVTPVAGLVLVVEALLAYYHADRLIRVFWICLNAGSGFLSPWTLAGSSSLDKTDEACHSSAPRILPQSVKGHTTGARNSGTYISRTAR